MHFKYSNYTYQFIKKDKQWKENYSMLPIFA